METGTFQFSMLFKPLHQYRKQTLVHMIIRRLFYSSRALESHQLQGQDPLSLHLCNIISPFCRIPPNEQTWKGNIFFKKQLYSRLAQFLAIIRTIRVYNVDSTYILFKSKQKIKRHTILQFSLQRQLCQNKSQKSSEGIKSTASKF